MKSQWTLAIAVFGLAGIALAGCDGVENAPPDPLDGTSWQLMSLDGRESLPGVVITAVFEGGSVHGSSGCNSFGATYQIHADSIVIRDIQSTLMACIEPEGAMDQEQEFIALLGSSERYRIADGQLRLMSSDQDVLAFVPQD
ncbi:MAG TPA: META domain-containing protein [Anaerolineales bacterium]|nr:META domain-containing protein [Anaerolineales bacterium]